MEQEPTYWPTESTDSVVAGERTPPPVPSSAADDAPEIPAEHRLIRLVVNGRIATDPLLRTAVTELRDGGHHVEVRVTWDEGDASLFAAEAALIGFDTVIAVGGDGTLNGVINGIMKSSASDGLAVGVVPYGTGNDFAAMAGIPTGDPVSALQLAVLAKPRMVDVGRLNGQLYINMATGGYAAEVTSQTPPEMKSFLGSAAYSLFGLATVGGIAARHTRVKAPGFEWDGNVYLIAVGNGRMAGGGFNVCPEAIIDDGLLDLVIVPELSFMGLVTLLNDLVRSGRHLSSDQVIHLKAPWIDVVADDGMQINLDGEPRFNTHFRFDIPGQVPMYLPAAAPLQSQAGG